ncbi:hypothetical protein QWI17_14805, partial [Gilvimarinus sp. SDUM040013]|uniref:hypothetical protein n=1 Tax=Gilvimarinus gilvus TaxID=3058038 RepID=UPI0026742022
RRLSLGAQRDDTQCEATDVAPTYLAAADLGRQCRGFGPVRLADPIVHAGCRHAHSLSPLTGAAATKGRTRELLQPATDAA